MQSPNPDGGKVLLRFDRPLAVVGGGAVEPGLLQDLAARGVALVGADGGGNAIGDVGIVPEAILGDLDSLDDRDSWEQRTRVIHIPEQITTDFQKALYSTSAPVTLALGMTGKRLDHTLAALGALLEVAPHRKVILVDETDVALAISGPFSFHAARGERISIHPLVPIVFERTGGLFYPMNDLLLDPAGRLGTSNEGTGGVVDIVPKDDTPWLLILGRERLWDLVEVCLRGGDTP
ncbi:thiamine diphosphokinase [Devosia lucknowensis]|uniref:Thiamine diphosphokinase n=1 Tax=Devosia lucknowensis TaxID=1096929 RepID=A0A1Y6FSX8_9HYPH|nr:thiamine diphosphokinase [Devosia lucknowensis]SMQ75633.1 thiamine diphosphokinase [Devosia lucknowensis]